MHSVLPGSSQTRTQVLSALGDAKGVGACRRAASRLCALPPPHFQNWPIPAGLVPAQVTRRVSGLNPPGGRGGGRLPLFISTGLCRWRVGVAGEGAGPGPTLQSRTKGRCVPRRKVRAAAEAPGGWRGGRSHPAPGVGQVGAAPGRPAVPPLQRSCWAGPQALTGKERPTFSGCGRRQTLPAQPGSRLPHAGPPAARGMQQGTLRWGGCEEPCRRGGGGRELGAGLGGRSSAAPRPALPGSAQHLNEAAGCRRTSRQLSGMNSRL